MALLIERQLPEEMLNHMVSFASQHTLSKLCLVSKQFNGLATTHLYSKIIIGHNSDIGMERSNISSLAHVLFTSPAHAALVTSVRVLQTWGRIDKECAKICEKHSWPGVGTPELKALAKSKLAKYTLRDEESNAVFEKISSGTDEGGVLAMVVLDLPNLRRLDMNFGLCDDHDAFVAMFELLADHKKIGNVLSWLRVDVIIKGEGDKYPNRTIHVAALLHMPNLRPFYGMKMGDQENDPDLVDGPFAKLKPRSCPVEHLELRTSKLHRGNLQLMMYATILGKLKTPVYGIGYVWAWCDVSHIDIMRSLQLHHGTLERLALSHEVHYPYQHENDDEPYPCDFRPFAALRYRRVASVYVWGHEGFNDPARLADLATKEMLWQILPVNLESSGFEDWSHKNIWMNMKTLHRALKHIFDFPKLNNIKIEFAPAYWSKDERFETLESFCRKADHNGIQTTIILTDLLGPEATELKWGWNEDVEWGECLDNQDIEKQWISYRQEEDLAAKIRAARDWGVELNDAI